MSEPDVGTSIADSPLIGTWTLHEWVNVDVDGRRHHPFGTDATGYICYTKDGHVFVHISQPGRAVYQGNDPFGGTLSEDADAVRSHISYAGRFTFHGDRVVHHVTQASFPNWVGGDQIRQVLISGDGLVLSAADLVLGGVSTTATLRWRRIGSP